MKAAIEPDYREAVLAVREYQKATRKDLPEILNRLERNAAARTVRHLPTTAKRKLSPYDPERKPSARNRAAPRMFYALAAKEGWKRGQGIKQEAIRRFQSRDRSRGFLKAMMIKIAMDFGAKLRSRGVSGKQAAKSRGVKATVNNLRAELITGLGEVAAIEIIEKAFKKGLGEATRDMREYAQRKMEKNAKTYSG